MTPYSSAAVASLPHSFDKVPYSAGESLVSRTWRSTLDFLFLRLVDDEVVVEDDDANIPEWVQPVVRRLVELQRLPDDWDSYGGIPVQAQHFDAVLRFLGRVMSDAVLVPDVVPMADGGVQLEWRVPGADVDFISDEELEEPTLVVTSETGDCIELVGGAAEDYFVRELCGQLAVMENLLA